MEGRACSCMITRIQRKQAKCKDTTNYLKKLKNVRFYCSKKQNIKQKHQINESQSCKMVI